MSLNVISLIGFRVGKAAQQTLAAKPDDRSSIPETHTVKGES